MATRKKVTKRVTKKKVSTPTQDFASARPSLAVKSPQARTKRSFRPGKKIIFLVIVLLLAALLFYKKNWIIAATVNGSPISTIEVMDRMNQKYKQETLNQMVNERILLDEARKKGINVSDDEINKKIADIEQQAGGADALNAYLAQGGQTRSDLQSQMRFEVIIEKLYKDEATVSAEEVNKYVEQNASLLQASDSATAKVQAETALKQQKLQSIFSEKFNQLRGAANIQIF